MRKARVISILIIILAFLCIMIFHPTGGENCNKSNTSDNNQNEINDNESTELTWDEISTNGIDEKELMDEIDTETLEKIATLLQELTNEIEKNEKEDPEFALSAGWYTYTLDSQQFNEVLDMGDLAAKPLYFILYKSPFQGLYEYICSMALERITTVEIDDWTNSKDFMDQFNSIMIEKKLSEQD